MGRVARFKVRKAEQYRKILKYKVWIVSPADSRLNGKKLIKC
jgi:hypothetical protein